MVQLAENISTKERDNKKEQQVFGRNFYDIKLIQRKFKLPERGKPYKGSLINFFYESILLTYFCLRDKRFRQISSVVFDLVKKVTRKDLSLPYYVKDAFVKLGSTFIKIGQFLSSRTDLLPVEYIEALSELQDSLPPIAFQEVKSLLEKELRKPIDKVFRSFDAEPVASASIGQVHKAILQNGAEVVVKIQRPDLNLLFYQDLAILRCIATYFERYTDIGKGREWVEIIDEIGKTLFEEIDFIQEGRNADRFRKNLKFEERIYIPKIYWQYTTRKLITIEYIPGIKITDIQSLKQNNHNPKELALILVYAYFKQFFEDGFYHADPHPGNIVVKDDGRIVFYDFGMIGRINEHIRKELANVLISIVGNDTETLITTLKNLDLIKTEIDIKPLKRVIEQAAYKYYDGAKLSSLNLKGIEDDLVKLFNEKPMKLPSKFAYTLRMTGTLEGVCRTLDPDFSLVSVAKPYLKYWIMENVPQSKWLYLKAMFPGQSYLVDKAKVYFEVLKDLPKYVDKIEKSKTVEEKSDKDIKKVNLLENENEILRNEVTRFYSKFHLANGVVLVFCLLYLGSFLAEKSNHAVSITGLFILISSLLGSIGLVSWAIVKRKVLE